MRSDKDDVDGRDVMQAIEYIKEIDKYICWVPTRMEETETWRSFLRGLAEAEGLIVDFEAKNAETDAEVEKSV